MSEELACAKLIKHGADRDLMQTMKLVNDKKAHLEVIQSERDELWDTIKPLVDLFCKPEDAGAKRWVDVIKDIPNRFKGYVRGATMVCVQNVLGTLRVLYSTMDLHQVATYYDDEGHLAAMERAEEELDGLATTITDELDLRMEKPDE